MNLEPLQLDSPEIPAAEPAKPHGRRGRKTETEVE